MHSVTTSARTRTIIALAAERNPDAKWIRVEFTYTPTVTTAHLIKTSRTDHTSYLLHAAGLDHEEAVLNLLSDLIAA